MTNDDLARQLEQLNKNLETLTLEVHHFNVDIGLRITRLTEEINDLRRLNGGTEYEHI